MSGGGGGGTLWIKVLVTGFVLCALGTLLEHHHAGPGWLWPALLGIGGLGVVFGSCEAMIQAVEGVGQRLRWNEYVAGTMAGLASNVPELVMLGFVLAAEPRVGFVVVALTLHVSALVLGVYSAVLPRDEKGHARLPEAMVRTSTDLFACAGGVFLTTGILMILMRAFGEGDHKGQGLGVADLYMIGGCLLGVQVVSVIQLIKRFASAPATGAAPAEAHEEAPPPWGTIAFFGALGIVTSVVGGHAVGDFADEMVKALKDRGYSEMVCAIFISLFACSGAYIMLATAHFKGKQDIALANICGQVTQVPFVVMPVSMILLAVFAQTGVIPYLPLPEGVQGASSAVLAIDLETTAVVILGFPIMLMLWKAIQDDGSVNWVETAVLVATFALIVFFLAVHG